MEDLGARLKLAREQQGISLKDIAARTKIAVTALEALERNDFTKLPGGIFGRAFVRAYAIEVGLDPDSTVSDFIGGLGESERAAAERNAVRVEVTPDDREFLERQRQAIRWLRTGGSVLAVVIVALVLWRSQVFLARRAAAPPRPIVTTSPPPAPVPPPNPVPAVADVAAPADPLVVEFEVTTDCWVSATADGARPVSQLMRSGQTQTVHAQREVLLDVGNAGALVWTINGKAAKALGRSGQHVHTRVTPETIAAFVQ